MKTWRVVPAEAIIGDFARSVVPGWAVSAVSGAVRESTRRELPVLGASGRARAAVDGKSPGNCQAAMPGGPVLALGADVSGDAVASEGVAEHDEELFVAGAPRARRPDPDDETPGPYQPLDHDMTLFYPDCSNNNWSSTQDAIDFLQRLVPEGFSGICHKVSEGSYYEDPYWPTVQHWCQTHNLSLIGYHYVTADDPSPHLAG
jgi:hypothetical protein